jgi:catechol 2,3-dioxygenase-like lactoylglutathione lyase family enzyme
MSDKPLLSRIDHIELVVNDLKESIEFLEMFGFEILRETGHHKGSAELKLPGENQPIIELHEAEDEENPGFNHVAFSTDEIDAVADLLKKKGVEHKGPFFFEPTGRILLNLRFPNGFRCQITTEKK